MCVMLAGNAGVLDAAAGSHCTARGGECSRRTNLWCLWKQITSYIVVEQIGSGVELQTLNYENSGSNPVLRCYVGKFFLYIAPVQSAV